MNTLEPNQTVKFTYNQKPCSCCGGKGYVDEVDELIQTSEPDEE